MKKEDVRLIVVFLVCFSYIQSEINGKSCFQSLFTRGYFAGVHVEVSRIHVGTDSPLKAGNEKLTAKR